jgi:hypothetical protein
MDCSKVRAVSWDGEAELGDSDLAAQTIPTLTIPAQAIANGGEKNQESHLNAPSD